MPASTLSAASAAGSLAGAATQTALETGPAGYSEAPAATEINASPETTAPGGANEVTTRVADLSEIEQVKAALEKRRKMFLVTALEGARRASLEETELCLEFAADQRHLRDTLANGENVKILREVCREITNRELGVRFAVADDEASGGGEVPVSREETLRREQQTLRETVEQDPVVQQMLRTFRGEIVDVKRADGKQ